MTSALAKNVVFAARLLELTSRRFDLKLKALNASETRPPQRALRPKFFCSSLILIPLLLAPLSAAIAQALDQRSLCPMPTKPWTCKRVADNKNGHWECDGRWQQPFETAVETDLAPTDVQADSVQSTDGQNYVLKGDVKITRGAQKLSSPEMQLSRTQNTAVARSPARMETRQIIAYADQIDADLANKTSELTDVRYALKDGRGNGRARKVTHRGAQSTLKGVSFTSCPDDAPAWAVRAHEIEIDQDAGIGIARDFKVVVGKVPVFYLPVASFPLTDARKSGLLMPTIGGGDDGVDISFPYYFNLAPNYDATLSSRIIQRRGFMLGGEFRYLGSSDSLAINSAFLPKDRLRDLPGSDQRYSFSGLYSNQLSQTWRFGANLNHVSDAFYFEDLGDSLSANATSILASEVGVYGRAQNAWLGVWDSGLTVDRYEIIDPRNPDAIDPYRRAPRIYFQSNQYRGAIHYGVRSELVAFKREQAIEGSRLDVAPFVSAEWRAPFAYIRPELQFRHTRYSLDEASSNTPHTRSDFRRSLPIASLDAGLYFDRAQAMFFPNLRQTLEPRLYYLRTPFRDQSDFPVFDTTELDFSFPQLFRTNRFSGADRQADAHQIAAAVSTRWIDDVAGLEKLRLSAGQIRYFDDSVVTLPGTAPFTSSAGVWVAEAQAQIGENWRVTAAKQYDPEINRTRLAAVRLQRQFGDKGVVNLGYRYRVDRLEQADISALVPIDERWSLIGRWNYSLPESRTLEGLAGFEYRSCCWRLRMVGRHYLRAGTLEGRNSLFFELELNGLGVVGRKTDRLLENAIVGFSDLNSDLTQ
jgi:LPS-assembly protein